MNVIIFGASGMVGQGVLRAALLAPDVEQVLLVGRTSIDLRHAKLRQLAQPDLFDYSTASAQLQGYDDCFFCLGVSAAGLDEAQYTRLTYDLTLAAAQPLAQRNPGMTMVYVSGAGTDSSEKGRTMWARVKGRTENALQRLPFKAVFLFRPGAIQPLHQLQSKLRSYRIFYSLFGALLPLARRWWPNQVLTTEVIGVAMLNLVRHGGSKAVLETKDINAAAQ